ncbi:minor capsid protein [Convivina praedatoris]|nr:minor capsid protein [Convivina sp. LMG 32447]
MDLLECLAKSINDNVKQLPGKLMLGYISETKPFAIYAQPGSKVISADYDGTQLKEMPFEVALSTNSLGQGDSVMWSISNYLDNLTKLDTDGTYTVERLDIQPQPFLSMADMQNKGLFLLDFSVQITAKRTQGDLN